MKMRIEQPVSLLEFLKTGRFGSLEVGDSRRRVEQLFGAPPSWSAEHEVERASIWKYGDIEFYFNDDLLWMIFADGFSILSGARRLKILPGVLSGRARVEDVVETFKREKISFTRSSFDGCERGVRLKTEAGVELTFCGNRGRKPRLISFNGR